MQQGLLASSEITIQAPPAKVWEALTKPELVKQYLHGTNMETTWEIGSPIKYHGEWKGKKYEDKGTVLEFVPEEKIVSTYWSSMGGTEDKPENYKTVSYLLELEGDATKVTITQDNNDSEKAKASSEANWMTVLKQLKAVLEQ